MSLVTLTDEEEKEFYKLSRYYWKEAKRCEAANIYFSGCVMLGSALEALLILMINCHSEEAENTGICPIRKGKEKPLMNWNLAELLKVAKSCGWLPYALDIEDDWNTRKAKIGDYAEVARMIRNLVHPARYVEDHFRKRITKKYLEQQFEVFLVCHDWLIHWNNKSLLKHIKEKENSND